MNKKNKWTISLFYYTQGSVFAQEYQYSSPTLQEPIDWLFHCHMTHHTMNQMGHGFPNVLGFDNEGFDEKVRELIPGYMTMGTSGMTDMTKSGMPLPENSIPMLGYKGQFGQTVLGSMANILMVRKNIDSYENPGPYDFPEGTVSNIATEEQMERDGIILE